MQYPEQNVSSAHRRAGEAISMSQSPTEAKKRGLEYPQLQNEGSNKHVKYKISSNESEMLYLAIKVKYKQVFGEANLQTRN